MIKIGQHLTYGRIYYDCEGKEDDDPYPGDDFARMDAVAEIHEQNKPGQFNLLHFEVSEYVARGQVKAWWTKSIFERVK